MLDPGTGFAVDLVLGLLLGTQVLLTASSAVRDQQAG
jgi:hypothetical protein